MQVASFSPDLTAVLHQPVLSDGLSAWQQLARSALAESRFPTRADEAWRYVPHRQLPALQSYVSPGPVKPRYDHPSADWDVYRIQFIDGVIVSSDRIPGVHITPLADCNDTQLALLTQELSEKDAWITLNQACLTHGVLIEVDAEVVVDKPLLLIDHTTDRVSGQCLQPRYVMSVAQRASVDFIMHHSSDSEVLLNAVSVIHADESARCSCLRLQQMHQQAVCLHQQAVLQAAHSDVRLGQFVLGASIAREAVHVALLGSEARVDLSGVMYPSAGQFMNTYSHLTHAVPHTHANQQYRSVVQDKAKAVFYGRVNVLPQAQKTASYQRNANLLLGKQAQANSKPELEIYADDVICSHGSTTGQLDDEQLFYLRSRGIAEADARALLVDGFARVCTDPWEESPAYPYLLKALAARGRGEG